LIHGGDSGAGPHGARASASAFAASSRAARAALDDARMLDAALDALTDEAPPPLSAALADRIFADADPVLRDRAAPGAESVRPVFGRARWAGPMGLAARAQVGGLMGWSGPGDMTAPFASAASVDAAAWQTESFLSADLMPSEDPFAE
jgi:hypothetical protein